MVQLDYEKIVNVVYFKFFTVLTFLNCLIYMSCYSRLAYCNQFSYITHQKLVVVFKIAIVHCHSPTKPLACEDCIMVHAHAGIM